MEIILYILCSLLCSFIIAYVMFQFMDERYTRRYAKNSVYIWGCMGSAVIITAVSLLPVPMLNLYTWMVLVALFAGILYSENGTGTPRKIFESELFIICMGFVEAGGVILIKLFLQITQIQLTPVGEYCLRSFFAELMMIFLYYTVIRRFFRKNTVMHSKGSYVIYLVILSFNLIIVFALVQEFFPDFPDFPNWNKKISAVNVCFILLANLYLLYFIKVADERRAYDIKVQALEQQAKLQYAYYLQQEQKYNQAIQILHDADKHIKSIKELCAAGNTEETIEYAEQIGNILKPLIPTRYTGNAILDILLSDKFGEASHSGVAFFVNLGDNDFAFMKPMDITTIFGNLLDNALEACEMVQDKPDRSIVLTAKKFQEIVSVTVENDCNPVKWRAGMPVSEKGENRGLGLLNVRKGIDRYDGDLTLEETEGRFIAEFFLNMK